MTIGSLEADLPDQDPESLLISLAGNAFSGFSIAPVVMVGLAIAGAREGDFDPNPTAADCDDALSEMSFPSSQD